MPPSRRYRPFSRARAALAAIVALVLAATGTLVGGWAAHATPNFQPKIAAVNARLDQLSKQYQALDEQYNAAVADLAAQRKAADAAQRQAQAAAQASVRAHERFIEGLTQQYEQGQMSSTGVLLTSSNPQSYLDNLSTMSYLSGQFAGLVTQARAAHTKAQAASAHAAKELAAAHAKATALQQRRATLLARTERFKKLLATLTARQRRAYARARSIAAAKARAAAAARARAAAAAQARQNNNQTTTPTPAPTKTHHRTPPPPTGSAVQRVVDFAIAQVGKPYVFAASGPNAYDCSGLTMAAWAQAGVQLPHLASGQYNVGQHVSYSQLQPGDLIFLYQPIEHVEIYVGHDLAVSAADPALGIVYVHPSQDMADYAGATRPNA